MTWKIKWSSLSSKMRNSKKRKRVWRPSLLRQGKKVLSSKTNRETPKLLHKLLSNSLRHSAKRKTSRKCKDFQWWFRASLCICTLNNGWKIYHQTRLVTPQLLDLMDSRCLFHQMPGWVWWTASTNNNSEWEVWCPQCKWMEDLEATAPCLKCRIKCLATLGNTPTWTKIIACSLTITIIREIFELNSLHPINI